MEISTVLDEYKTMQDSINEYKVKCGEKDKSEIKTTIAYGKLTDYEIDNFEERYDKGLVVDKIRPDVSEEVRIQVFRQYTFRWII